MCAKLFFFTHTPPHLSPEHSPLLLEYSPLATVPTTLGAHCTKSVGVAISFRCFLALGLTLDYFASLTPFEVIRVEERVNHDDDVHEGRGEEVDKETNKVLDALLHISWKPEADAE